MKKNNNLLSDNLKVDNKTNLNVREGADNLGYKSKSVDLSRNNVANNSDNKALQSSTRVGGINNQDISSPKSEAKLDKTNKSKLSKLSELVKKILDCCKE